MTDLEKFVKLYKEFGIDCKVNNLNDNKGFVIMLNYFGSHAEGTESKKLEGYNHFYSRVDFDENRKFVSQGFYE